jgi:hypothetical protein
MPVFPPIQLSTIAVIVVGICIYIKPLRYKELAKALTSPTTPPPQDKITDLLENFFSISLSIILNKNFSFLFFLYQNLTDLNHLINFL